MSDFMITSLEDLREKLKELPATTETTGMITLTTAMISNLKDAEEPDPLLATVSEDIEKLKKQKSVLKDFKTWLILIPCILALSGSIWGVFTPKLKEDLKSDFLTVDKYEHRILQLEEELATLRKQANGKIAPQPRIDRYGKQFQPRSSFPMQTQQQINN